MHINTYINKTMIDDIKFILQSIVSLYLVTLEASKCRYCDPIRSRSL